MPTTTPLLSLNAFHYSTTAQRCIGDLGSTTGWAYKAMEGRLVASFHLFSAWKKLVGNGRGWGLGVGGGGGGGGGGGVLAHQHISGKSCRDDLP